MASEQRPRTRLRTEESSAPTAAAPPPPPGLSSSWQFMPESTHSSPGVSSADGGGLPSQQSPPTAPAAPAPRVFHRAQRTVPSKGGSSSSSGGRGVARFDPRLADRPTVYDETAEGWRIWKVKFVNFMSMLDPRFRPALGEAEKHSGIIESVPNTH